MTWEYVIVGAILLTAVTFAGRFFYRTLTGRQKPCESCPSPDSCSLGKTPEDVANRLRASASGEDESA